LAELFVLKFDVDEENRFLLALEIKRKENKKEASSQQCVDVSFVEVIPIGRDRFKDA